jgi:hypothetical protein
VAPNTRTTAGSRQQISITAVRDEATICAAATTPQPIAQALSTESGGARDRANVAGVGLPCTTTLLKRFQLPSGRVVNLIGLGEPDRPWQAVEESGVYTVRRQSRGDSARFDAFKAGGRSASVLNQQDAEALAGALNARRPIARP